MIGNARQANLQRGCSDSGCMGLATSCAQHQSPVGQAFATMHSVLLHMMHVEHCRGPDGLDEHSKP